MQQRLKPTSLVIIFALVTVSLTFGLSAATPGAQAAPYSAAELSQAESSNDAQIRAIRNEEMAQIKQTLGRRNPTNRMAELYFRLAELNYEAYQAQFLVEGKAHEKRVQAGMNAGTIDRSSSRPYLRQGIQACEELVRLGIPFERMDQVYFFLGFNHSELGDERRGSGYFDVLTRKFPNSPLTPEAYRLVGEAAFNERNFRKAHEAYAQAERRVGDDAQRARIQHRQAWTLYRLREYRPAVEKMKQAVASASTSGEKMLNLKEEALRDLALFMTETGQVEEALRYFQNASQDSEFYPKALERLAKQYERNAEPEKAIKIYESLLRTRPDSDAAIRALVKLVDIDLRRSRFREALDRVTRFNFNTASAREADGQTAISNLRAMIRRTATENHEKFRKEHGRPSLEVAELYYTAYLNQFLAKDDPRHEIPEVQMYLAEVKKELGKTQDSANLYRQVIASGDKRYAKEAAAFWTASLAENLKATAAKGNIAKGEAPSAAEREFVDAADRLQSTLGDTPEAREAQLRAAQVLGGYRSTQKESIERAKRIIEARPRSPQALTAARLWLQTVSDGASGKIPNTTPFTLEELRESMNEVKANASLMGEDREKGGGKLAAQISDEETRLKVKAIASDEKDEDFSEAGKGYEALAAENPNRDLSEKAFANAARAYLKARDNEGVERVGSRWLKKYPKSPKAIESLRTMATQYLIAGEFELAAKIFERLGTEAKDPDSLETAARLFEGTGSVKRAQQDWQYHIEAYRGAATRWSVALMLAESQESTGDDSGASKTYQFCLTGPAEFQAECGSRLGDLYLRNKDPSQARAMFQRVSNLGGAPAPAPAAPAKKGKKAKAAPAAVASAPKVKSPFVGYARFKLAELSEREARFEALKLPEEQLKRALTQRLAYLEPLSRSYNLALEAGGPWGIAALDRLASWALNFSKEIDAIEPPKSLDANQVQRFRANLASISDPLKKKALTTWREGYEKALQAEALSSAVPVLYDHLVEAGGGGGNLFRAQGPRGKLRLAGVAPDGGADGQKGALKKVRDRLEKSPQDAEAWVDYGNLLWGQNRPLLSKIAYERAMALNSKHLEAANNRAVVLILGSKEEAEEDWFIVGEADQFFQLALREDPFFLPAKINRATLLNYYRLFRRAKPLWEQIQVKVKNMDAEDGLGIVQQSEGNRSLAERSFANATELGAPKKRFARLYHQAAGYEVLGTESGYGDCRDALEDLDADKLSGFEKAATVALERSCKRGKP